MRYTRFALVTGFQTCALPISCTLGEERLLRGAVGFEIGLMQRPRRFLHDEVVRERPLPELADDSRRGRAQCRRLVHDDPGLFEKAVGKVGKGTFVRARASDAARSEEHTSELQSLMRISYAVFCLKKKQKTKCKKDTNS